MISEIASGNFTGARGGGAKAKLTLSRISAASVGMRKLFTAVITREEDGYVSLCPELDIASQGDTVEEARSNLKEAVELFFECASEAEVLRRFVGESYVSTLEVNVA